LRKTFFALAALALASSSAFAGPAPALPSDTVTIVVTRAELQSIAQGVMKLPYEAAAPILNSLQAQLNAADKAKAEKDAPVDHSDASKAEKKPAKK
jgi:hypothetical protein